MLITIAIAKAVSAAAMAIANRAKKHSLHLPREKKAVENHKVDVNRVEHQFQRDKDGDQILTGDKTVNAAGEHHQTRHQIIKHCQIHCNYLLRAITTPPIIHANNNTLIASKGKRYSNFSVPSKACPIFSTVTSLVVDSNDAVSPPKNENKA